MAGSNYDSHGDCFLLWEAGYLYRSREEARESAYELADVSRLVHFMMENCKLLREKAPFGCQDLSENICISSYSK